MTYPGDPSLSPDVQHRILTTYRQTLQLASQGSRQEALLGCDFVLRLDPQFGPARVLQQMIHGGSPAQAFQELFASAPPVPPKAEVPAQAAMDGLSGLSLGAPAPPTTSATAPADLADRLARLVEARQFGQVLALAETERRAVTGDPRLRELVEQAQARLEAEPYLLTFLESARQARAAGETDEAERLIRKARSLDPTHPELAALEPGRGRSTEREAAFASGSFADLAEPPDADADLELPDLDFPLPDELPSGFDLEDAGAPATEGEGRIAELLREGQAAFDRGEHQSAIDSWSRIFLIDIDHQEAARRIEQARQLKAEREREVEEIFHDAVARFDSSDFEGAGETFRRVLELQPGYVLAQEYLEKIAERAAGGPAPPPPRALPPIEPPGGVASPGAGMSPAATARPPATARDQLSEEILVPPDPGMAAAPARRAPSRPVSRAAKPSAAPSGRFLLIGGAVLALLAGGGWFVASRWSQLFPNAKPGPATPAPVSVSAIERAQQLHAEGKTAIAIAQLRRLPPQDPHYSEAQSLVSQWETLQQESEKPQLSPALAGRRRELIESAGRALANGENARARSQLEQAAQIAPLDGNAAEHAVTARERLAPFAEELRLVQQGDYDYALNLLWRRRENEKDNRDLDRLIVDSYYNLGVLDLQRSDPQAARERFAEARKLDPGDPVLERLERFSVAYAARDEDLLYRIFVKYLLVR